MTAALRIGSLFSGYGGLEMGVQLALGGTTAWHCEFDADPSAILAHHWPGVPNLGDITKVDWSTVERVDVLCGGSPCQDVSTAGSRKGMKAGTRSGLWAAMVDAIEALRPPIVVWENVRGVTSAEANSDVELCAGCVGDESGVYLRALGRVLGDLADLGYDAVWHGLRAADVGAPHGRFRIFVVAVDARHGNADGAVRAQAIVGVARGRAGAEPGRVDRGGPAAADAADDRRGARARDGRGSRSGGQAGQPQERGVDDAADADGPGSVGLVPRPLQRVGHAARADVPDVQPRSSASDADVDRLQGPRRRQSSRRAVAQERRGAAADTHGDARGLEVDGASEGVRPRELLLGPAAPTRARGRRRPAAADAGYDGRSSGRKTHDDDGAIAPGDVTDGRTGQPARIITAAEAGIDFGEFALAVRRWELILGRPAPAPVEREITKKYPEGHWVLSPAFSEWMMGLPAGHVSDPAIPLSRGARLKACGNGVVPQQAAEAIRVCLSRMPAVPALVQPAPLHEQTQICLACGKTKPLLSEFGFNTHGTKRTPRGVCKACRKAGRRASTHTSGSNA